MIELLDVIVQKMYELRDYLYAKKTKRHKSKREKHINKLVIELWKEDAIHKKIYARNGETEIHWIVDYNKKYIFGED